MDRYGPVALIAGGSEGVGAQYARQLAQKGLDLVLVARTAETLEATRKDLQEAFSERRIETIVCDLTAPETPAMLAESMADREIGLLIYNAGSNWKNGDFFDTPLDHARALTALNITAHERARSPFRPPDAEPPTRRHHPRQFARLSGG